MYASLIASSHPAREACRADTVGTKWLFIGLCAYFLAQGFTVPLLAVGSTWALWPTLSDLATGALVVGWLFSSRSAIVLPALSRRVLLSLLVIFTGSLLSYLLLTVLIPAVDQLVLGSGKAVTFGAFALYRLAEFTAVFWLTSLIPLSPRRRTILGRVASVTLLFVCGGIILTYYAIVPTSNFVAHIPASAAVSGPWFIYGLNREGHGLGTIGYNHAYVGAQVMVLLGIVLHFRPRLSLAALFPLLALTTFAILLTGSRAGLLAQLLFVTIFLWRRSPLAAIQSACLLAIAGLVILVIMSSPTIAVDQSSAGDHSSIVDRQLTAFQFYESTNLSGRDTIWQSQIAVLNEHPIWWVVGGGFGMAAETTPNLSAHMLPLQVVVETGLLGLTIFCLFVVALLASLWTRESRPRPLFWITVALLISSASYEIFYPIASMGHFLGIYLCIIAIALRRSNDTEAASSEHRSVMAGFASRAAASPPIRPAPSGPRRHHPVGAGSDAGENGIREEDHESLAAWAAGTIRTRDAERNRPRSLQRPGRERLRI